LVVSCAQSLRVLIVEDDPAFAELMAFLLRTEAGAEIVGRPLDGVEGVRLARELRPDVVVMDLRMPRMDGFEATRQIVGKLPGTRVLAVSASMGRDDIRRALDAGAYGFLSKGLVVAELTTKVLRIRPRQRSEELRLSVAHGLVLG
jgi:DNA-binding NarL/FixJ family response regulator